MTTQIIVEHLRVVSHWDLVLNLEKKDGTAMDRWSRLLAF